MARIDTVKRLLGAKSSTSRAKMPSKRSGDLAYVQQLRKDIEQTKRYIQQADKAIASLQYVDRPDQDFEKPRVVALYDSSGKIPFIPDHDEAIGSAIASTALGRSIRDYDKLISTIRESVVDPEELTLLLEDYREISHLAAASNEKGSAKLKDMESKLIELSQQTALVRSSKKALDAKIKDGERMASLLSLHLKRALTKYLALQNWEQKVTIDSSALKSTIKQIMLMLNDLLAAPPETWVEIIPTSVTSQLIKTLVFNDIVTTREDSNSAVYFLKMRDFGA